MPFRIDDNDFPAGRINQLNLLDTVRSLVYLYRKLAGTSSWRDEPSNNISLNSVQDNISGLQSSVTQAQSGITNLSNLSSSQSNRIAALEALIIPRILWRYGASETITPQTSLTTVASFTIPSGTVDSPSRILTLDAAFSGTPVSGTRTVQMLMGGIIIWAGTINPNSYIPVRKTISFDSALTKPRTAATNNAGYSNATATGVYNFANFNLNVPVEVKISAINNAMTCNIEHIILSII